MAWDTAFFKKQFPTNTFPDSPPLLKMKSKVSIRLSDTLLNDSLVGKYIMNALAEKHDFKWEILDDRLKEVFHGGGNYLNTNSYGYYLKHLKSKPVSKLDSAYTNKFKNLCVNEFYFTLTDEIWVDSTKIIRRNPLELSVTEHPSLNAQGINWTLVKIPFDSLSIKLQNIIKNKEYCIRDYRINKSADDPPMPLILINDNWRSKFWFNEDLDSIKSSELRKMVKFTLEELNTSNR